MKKLFLYSENKLSHSLEFNLNKKDMSSTSIIILIFIIIIILILFICFGKIDDVVKTSGIIRPNVNISQIKNITAGEIEDIYYSPGQHVEKGTILIRLNQESLFLQKAGIETQYKDALSKLWGLQEIQQSYICGKNIVSIENPVPYTRFNSYLAECAIREAKRNQAFLLYEEEKQLPNSGTTPIKIRNLEYEYHQLCDSISVFKTVFLESIVTEISETEIILSQLTKQLEQIEINLRNTVLCSPVPGSIQEISSLNKGDFIFADQKILNIIPDDTSDLRIELRIPAKDAGKLKKGMQVKLRFPAFPYYEFKGAEGIIQTIDADAQASSSGDLFFTVLSNIDKNDLSDKKGESYPLKVGLEVDARIVLETQPILYFLLKKMDFMI